MLLRNAGDFIVTSHIPAVRFTSGLRLSDPDKTSILRLTYPRTK